MKVDHKLIAQAQVAGFLVCLVGFLALLFVLVLVQPQLSATADKVVTSMLAVLGTILTGMVAYFFSRQRTDTPPPPEEPKP